MFFHKPHDFIEKLLYSIVILNFPQFISSATYYRSIGKCDSVKIPMCQAMRYNMTRMPNLLHHSTQENAKLAIEQFEVLVEQNCSDTLLFFLCAMYAPICAVDFQPDVIPPCKGVCEKARNGCEPLMNQHNVSWPETLNCDELPRYDRGVCISPEAIVSSAPKGRIPGRKKDKQNKRQNQQRNKADCHCKRKLRASPKLFRSGNYDYAIRAKVRKTKYSKRQSRTKIYVLGILLKGKVPISVGQKVYLWTNSTCVCPKLSKGEYFIIGHENFKQGKLLFLNNSIVARWKHKFTKRFPKWLNKRRKTKKRRRRRKNRNRNVSKGNSTEKIRNSKRRRRD